MKKELIIFSSLTIISFILHLLVVFKIYYPGHFWTMPITAGMIFSWLFTSAIIRDKKSANEQVTFPDIIRLIPLPLRIVTICIFIYAMANFVNHFTVHDSGGWVDFTLSHDKISGLSGFWIIFYMVGLCGAWIKNRTV